MSSEYPTAKIIPSVTKAKPGQTVTLDGAAESSGAASFKWHQPKGTSVQFMPSTEASVVSFIANENFNVGQSIEHTLGFQLWVKDASGKESAPDTVDILVTASTPPVQSGLPPTPPPAPPPTETAPEPSPAPPPSQTQAHQAQLKFTADVMNFSTKISVEGLQAIGAAIQKQMDGEHGSYWGATANFNYGQPVKGNVKLGVFDSSRQEDALGWHDAHGDVVTIAIFYVGTYEDLCITISHEMLETIVDMNAETTMAGIDESGKECLYYLEDCDAVESDSYLIDGIKVSDFVTPAWFEMEAASYPALPDTPPDGKFDYLEKTKKAFDIAPGGYMPVSYDGGQTWTGTTARTSGMDRFSGARARMRDLAQSKKDKQTKKKKRQKKKPSKSTTE